MLMTALRACCFARSPQHDSKRKQVEPRMGNKTDAHSSDPTSRAISTAVLPVSVPAFAGSRGSAPASRRASITAGRDFIAAIPNAPNPVLSTSAADAPAFKSSSSASFAPCPAA